MTVRVNYRTPQRIPTRYPLRDLPANTVGYWDMQTRGSSLLDHSGRKNDLTNVGTNIVAANRGYARAYDGIDDYSIQQNIASGSATANQLMLSTADGQAFLQHFSTDFSGYAAGSLADKPYMTVIKDAGLDVAWGYAGPAAADTLGAELVTNGGFDTDTTWIKTGNWIINNGVASCTNPVAYHYLVQSVIPLVNGMLYKLQYTVVSNTLSSSLGFGLSSAGAFGLKTSLNTSIGVHTYYLNCINSAAEYDINFFLDSATGVFELDNVSVKAVTESLGEELCLNNGFETYVGTQDDGITDTFTSWSPYGTDADNRIEATATKVNGANALKIITNHVLSPSLGQGITVTPGKLYKLTFFSRGDGTNAGAFTVFDNTNSQYIYQSVSTGVSGTTYLLVNRYFTIPAGCVSIQVIFYPNKSVAATAYFDDISVKEVTAPVATGLKLYSTKTGTTQNMANTAAAFSPNNALTYEVRKTDFQITGALTVGAWVKGAAQSTKSILSKRDVPQNGMAYIMSTGITDSSKVNIRLSIDGAASTKNYESSVVCLDSTWHFLVFTWSDSVLRLFVDGIEDANPTKSTDGAMTDIKDVFTPVLIGANNFNHVATGFFAGQIAHTFILNRAMTATEVLQEFRRNAWRCGVSS